MAPEACGHTVERFKNEMKTILFRQIVSNMDQIMDLSTLADFHLVASQGGFGKASRASGRPKATLSRRIMDLEQSLGIRLLERGSRSLRLTDEGQALLERIQGPLGEIVEATELAVAGLATPREHGQRGSQVCLTRQQGAYAIVQALIARGVIGDFRKGDGGQHLDILRFGFTPLYIGFEDVWHSVEHLKQVLESGEWKRAEFNQKHAVT